MKINNHSSDSGVHISQRVAKATSSKNVKPAPTTSDSEGDAVSRTAETPRKQCGLGLYVVLLVTISILFVAGATLRRYRDAKEFSSSEVFAAIENDDDQFRGFDSESSNDDDFNGNGNSTTVAPSLGGSVNDENTTRPTEDDDSDVAEEFPTPSPMPTEADSNGNDYSTTLAPSFRAPVDDETTTRPSEDDDYNVAEETPAPSPNPTNAPPEIKTVIFAAIGDVPYTNWEAKKLKTQMDELDETAEFVIHVGDIRSAANNNDCYLSEFVEVAEILLRSPVPVFIIPGDNDG